MTGNTTTPIRRLTDKTVARLRTVIPGLWGAGLGMVITWAITHGWLPAVAGEWKDTIATGTATIVVGVCIDRVYALARWVEARRSPAARLIARLLLVVLTPPTYTGDGR